MPYLTRPLLLGLNMALISGLLQLGLDRDLVYMLGLFSSLRSMALNKMLWPYRPPPNDSALPPGSRRVLLR